MRFEKLLEVCIDNFDDASKAVAGGAKRLEICSSLAEGGLTPSIGLVTLIADECKDTSLYVMIRCKSGSDFYYTESDLRVMVADICMLKKLNINGFVFGALKIDKTIDEVACQKILSAAHPLPVTFHRAFDVCENPLSSLETIISLGFIRILTSGMDACAASDVGCTNLKMLLNSAGIRIIIMAGSGINQQNVRKVLDLGINEVHASCLVEKETEIASGSAIEMGKNESGKKYYFDQTRTESLVSILNEYVTKSEAISYE